jgi:hypothetical protein
MPPQSAGDTNLVFSQVLHENRPKAVLVILRTFYVADGMVDDSHLAVLPNQTHDPCDQFIEHSFI